MGYPSEREHDRCHGKTDMELRAVKDICHAMATRFSEYRGFPLVGPAIQGCWTAHWLIELGVQVRHWTITQHARKGRSQSSLTTSQGFGLPLQDTSHHRSAKKSALKSVLTPTSTYRREPRSGTGLLMRPGLQSTQLLPLEISLYYFCKIVD